MLRRSLEAFFFDGAAGSLFGCSHPPASGRGRRAGVVLCGSVAEEHVSFHRALRRLALMLSEEGFPVLRFDLFAVGDSSGSCDEGRVELWQEDVDAAIEELRRRSGVSALALVGLRLGGALAYAAAVRRTDVGALVLWDPAVDGNAYVDELESLYRDMLDYAHVDAAPEAEGSATGWLWGLPACGATWASVRRIDLSTLGPVAAAKVLVVQTNERTTLGSLVKGLEDDGVRVAQASLPIQEQWTWLEDFSRISVPVTVLRTIVDWLREESA
jgi:uncharacterized protein